jgi:hypothetical protein
MNRIEKIEAEMQKTRGRIVKLQARLRELDGERTEQENLAIVAAVRALKLTPKELRAFMDTGALPASMSEAYAISAARYQKKKPDATGSIAAAQTPDTESEDTTNED